MKNSISKTDQREYLNCKIRYGATSLYQEIFMIGNQFIASIIEE